MDLFVTVLYDICYPVTGALSLANESDDSRYVRRAEVSVEVLNGKAGRVLGAMTGISVPMHSIRVECRGHMVRYAEGVTAVLNPINAAHGSERLVADLPSRDALRRRCAVIERAHARSWRGHAPNTRGPGRPGADSMAGIRLLWNDPGVP